MTEDELFTSVKLHCNAVKSQTDYDELAEEVNFDVEEAAQKIVADDSDSCQLVISIFNESDAINKKDSLSKTNSLQQLNLVN